MCAYRRGYHYLLLLVVIVLNSTRLAGKGRRDRVQMSDTRYVVCGMTFSFTTPRVLFFILRIYNVILVTHTSTLLLVRLALFSIEIITLFARS